MKTKRIHCAEVETVKKYFNLLEVISNPAFSDSVRGRVQAFIDNKADFNSVIHNSSKYNMLNNCNNKLRMFKMKMFLK